MKKKTILIALAVQGGVGLAHAQSSVTVYGTMDVAIERVSNVGASGASINRMPGLSGSAPSRVGFRGQEDLGNGLKASFVLETGFGPDTGTLNQGGRLFGRQSTVGLGGTWGTVTLGRQNTLLGTATSAADFIGPATHGIAAIDSYFPNARFDNSVAYRGNLGGFTLGAMHSLGRDAVNAGPTPAGSNCPGEGVGGNQACRAWSAAVRYDAPSWGVAFGADVMRGGPGAFGGLTAAMTDRRAALAGYIKVEQLRLGAAQIRRTNEASAATPRSDIWMLSASYPVTSQFTLAGQYLRYDLKSSGNDARMMTLRGTYALSKRTAVYASLARMNNKGGATFSVGSGQTGSYPLAGRDQNGLAMGVSHTF